MEELVKKAKNDDKEAFDELILLMQKQMYYIAKSKLRNDDDVLDAIQETILLCYKNIHKLKNESFFKTWLVKILINECKAMYRKRNRVSMSFEEKDIDEVFRIEENYEANIAFDILIKNLNEDERLILTLYYVSKYTTKEISEIINKNENTVRTKIARAKNKLKNQYEGEYL